MTNGGLILQSRVFKELEGQIIKKNIYISPLAIIIRVSYNSAGSN